MWSFQPLVLKFLCDLYEVTLLLQEWYLWGKFPVFSCLLFRYSDGALFHPHDPSQGGKKRILLSQIVSPPRGSLQVGFSPCVIVKCHHC